MDNSCGVSLLVCSRSYAIHPRNPYVDLFYRQLRISYFSLVCSRIRYSFNACLFLYPLLSVVINKTALNKPDQTLGFIFGVLRGIALIAISFFAYQTILSTGTFIILEESQSARVFGGMADDIAEKNPEKALGWLTLQYEQLVSVCEN